MASGIALGFGLIGAKSTVHLVILIIITDGVRAWGLLGSSQCDLRPCLGAGPLGPVEELALFWESLCFLGFSKSGSRLSHASYLLVCLVKLATCEDSYCTGAINPGSLFFCLSLGKIKVIVTTTGQVTLIVRC